MAAARQRQLRLYGTDGTTLTRQADGSYRVTDGADAFTLEQPRLQPAVVPQQHRAALGMAARQHALRGVAAEPRQLELANGEHVGVDDLFGSLSAAGDNIFAVKSTFWISR